MSASFRNKSAFLALYTSVCISFTPTFSQAAQANSAAQQGQAESENASNEYQAEYNKMIDTPIMDKKGFMQYMKQAFDAKDANHDGRISDVEGNSNSASNSPMLSDETKAEISREQAQQNSGKTPKFIDSRGFAEEMEKQFEKMDKNRDGKVTAAEMSNMYSSSNNYAPPTEETTINEEGVETVSTSSHTGTSEPPATPQSTQSNIVPTSSDIPQEVGIPPLNANELGR